MDNILTYLLGAGASCNSVPLVNEINSEMDKFVTALKDFKSSDRYDDPYDDGNTDHLIRDIRWLIRNSKNHASIDTYAKKLFFTNDRHSLHKLKSIISCFFIYRQYSKTVDYRYDSFFASILLKNNDKISIPENINILTWNYDNQLEKAFYGFVDDEDITIDSITKNKNIKRINGYVGTKLYNQFGLEFRASLHSNSDNFFNSSIEQYNMQCISKVIINLYSDYMDKEKSFTSNINFAWESITKEIISDMSEILAKTTILIIIGYSFPFFNRDVDRAILLSMGNLDKIIIQNPDHNSVKERLIALKPELNNIQNINDTKLFHIPNEF